MDTVTRASGTALLVISLLASQGCGTSSPTAMAQSAVTSFHSQLNAAQFETIWTGADELFRGTTTHDHYAKLTGGVHNKLGLVVNTTQLGWTVNHMDAQTRVTLHERTQFQHGSGVETFMYIVRGNTAKLAGYNIQSDDHITS